MCSSDLGSEASEPFLYTHLFDASTASTSLSLLRHKVLLVLRSSTGSRRKESDGSLQWGECGGNASQGRVGETFDAVRGRLQVRRASSSTKQERKRSWRDQQR